MIFTVVSSATIAASLKYSTVSIVYSTRSHQTIAVINTTQRKNTYRNNDPSASLGFRSGRVGIFGPTNMAINDLSINSNPYVQFTYDSSLGYYSVEDNGCASNMNYPVLYVMDKSICPSTHPYKKTTSSMQCWGCESRVINYVGNSTFIFIQLLPLLIAQCLIR